MKLIIFGGTTEGRELSERMAAAGALVFIGEGSDRFVYVSVMDGDKFIKDNSTTSPVIVPGPSD